jgi:hypothetical protein
MFIRLTDAKRGLLAEVMCDICNMPIELDESCDYLTPQAGASHLEAHLAHRTCVRDHPGRFPGFWSQMVSPRSILQTISEQDRHPQIVKLLRDLKDQRKDPIT